jgi:hypothetical protein
MSGSDRAVRQMWRLAFVDVRFETDERFGLVLTVHAFLVRSRLRRRLEFTDNRCQRSGHARRSGTHGHRDAPADALRERS